MARYMVERTFPDRLTIRANDEGDTVLLGVVDRNAELGVSWVHSYVSEDRTETFCVYDGPDPEATLDSLQYLARRIDSTCALLVVTYRDDVARTEPISILLGDLTSVPAVRRLAVLPLSAGAVAELTIDTGLDPLQVHAETNGNAFFVTEILRQGSHVMPASVAVLARVRRLRPAARQAVEVLHSLAPGSNRHAEEAGDAAAVFEFAPAAGDTASRLSSHREAAFHYARALRFADRLRAGDRTALLAKRAASACYSTSGMTP